jgi:hypothetical protein
MRAASPPVSFSLRSLSSAMFLGHARPTRLAVVYLLFTVALVLVPKADISETPFDEANTPTNEIVVKKDASLWEPSAVGHSVCAKNICATAKDQCLQNFPGLCRPID